METPAENKRIVLRQIEAFNAGDLDALGRFAHPDFFDHGTPWWEGDERLEPLDIVADSDRVVVRARGGGGAQQIHIWRLADGLVVEHWSCADDVDSVRRTDRRTRKGRRA